MDLTKNEEKIIGYYREMDETTKEAFIKIGEYYANSCITIKNLKKDIIKNIEKADKEKVEELLETELSKADENTLKEVLKFKLEQDLNKS